MYTALAAALFAAPAVSAFELKHGKFPGFPKDPENEHNDHDGFKTGGYTSVSYSKCDAKATTKNFSASKDAHAHAIAEAWKYACSDDAPSGKGYWYYIYKNAFEKDVDYDYGFAFAKAIATAKTECVSYSNSYSGNAYGCAAAYAYADAWATAVATTHAKAWAEAYNKCQCNDKWQQQAAASDNYAYDAKYFSVKAKAYAESYVCAYKNQYNAHYDAETCIQHIYFATIAHAVAHAAIDGNCIKSYDYYSGTYKEYAEYTAEAKSEALAVIDVGYVYGCFGYKHDYNPYH